MTIGVAG